MEQFGKYQLVRKIGTGGMAEVFLARTQVAQGLAKTLVIKKIHPAFARSRQFVAMFVDEAKIALGLNHPNIVQVFDFGAVGDTYFLAMENVEGLDLLRLLQSCAAQKRRIPYGLSAYVVQQLAKGLDYAHRKADEFGEALGIVHRDISPQNVLLSWDGAVKIVDFGIARARDVHEDEGVIKGKFAYMSPEQARGEVVDCRSDVFSAGIVLYELVCARPLFPGKGKEALELVKAGAIPRPRDFAPELPESLERTILRALAFHKSDRFQTARDLQNELGRFQLDYALEKKSRDQVDLIDSGALAQWLSQVTPPDMRVSRTPSLRPPMGDDSEPAARPSIPSIGSLPSTEERPEIRERKYVYVVEGVIRGLAALDRRLGAGGAKRVVDEFLEVARDVAYKLDALVDYPREGDAAALGRDVVRIVVGLPVAAEDDASRTIRIALALVDALDGIGNDVEPELRLAVGIQRGIATVTRRPGAPKASDAFRYELEHQTTGFAEKLARQARGAEVLVGGRVFRAARADWTFEALAAIELPAEDTAPQVPGDEDTQPGTRRARVYRLRGPKERAQRLRDRARADGKRLIGRELELKMLKDAYRDVMGSRGKRHVLVVGDAGVGKRTLVSSFVASIPKDEAIVIRTSTRVGTALTPYAVIADLARDFLGLAEGAEPHEVQRRLERALPLLYPGEEGSREARGALQAVGLLLGVRPADLGVDEIDPDERRQRISQIMQRVEQRLQTDKPLVVIGEDVHWSDQETLELFLDLVKVPTSRPLFGVVTSRPDRRVLEAARQSGADVLTMDELDAEARLKLVTDRFVPGHDVEELAQQVVARAGGNAFYINEMIDALIERGIAIPDPAGGEHPGLLRWIKRDAGVPMPTSIEDLLATRFDRLPGSEKDALLCASVLGRMIAAPFLSTLIGRPARGDLDELVRRGLLAPTEPDASGDPQYRFKNDMTMTVAYGLLPGDEKTRLHRIAAARIAGATGYRPGQDDALIARHLELAGDASDAADRYLRAARHAVDVGGNADAFRQLSRALKLLPETEHVRRFDAHKQRSEILQRLARRPGQLREIHAMRKEAEALGDPGRLAATHAALAQFYIDVGKAPAAARAVIPALDYARQAKDKLAEAEALRLRSSIARLAGNFEEALRLGEQALALVDEPADPSSAAPLLTRATILNNQGTTLWNMGRLEQAIEAYAEALVIYRALGLPRPEARALNNMGIVFAALGEFEEALSHYKSSLKIDQQLGDRSGIGLKLGNIGQAYADLGDGDRAESYLGKAIKIAEQTGDNSTLCDCLISLGQARLTRGDARGGLDLLERGLELATANRERYQEIRALEYIAFGQLEAGDPPGGALELATSATELARKMPMLIGVIYGLAAQGLALSKLGRHDDAVAATAEAVRLQAEQSRPEGAEHVLWWHAQVCRAAGRAKDADAAIRRAAEEVNLKAGRLHDAELRRIYLASRTPSGIRAAR